MTCNVIESDCRIAGIKTYIFNKFILPCIKNRPYEINHPSATMALLKDGFDIQ